MTSFIFFVIVGLGIWSYVKFRKQYRLDSMLCDFMRERLANDSHNPQAAVEYGCALMQAQQYRSALTVFEEVKRSGANARGVFPYLDANIQFCRNPHPWSRRAEDHPGGSWLHHLLMRYMGGRRMVAISDVTLLEFNSRMRMLPR